MKKFTAKMSISQTLFAAFFVATIITFVPDLFEWNNRLYLGIFAGITSLAGTASAKILFKDKE